MMGEAEWKRTMNDAVYRCQWRKLLKVIDAQKLEVRAIEMKPNSVVDAPVLPSLLGMMFKTHPLVRSEHEYGA